ncbi:hypothetical protein HNR54_000281 [Methanothermobacter sp. DSM 3267]
MTLITISDEFNSPELFSKTSNLISDNYGLMKN